MESPIILPTLVLTVLTSPEFVAENVALYKSGTFCNASVSEELFDGERNISQPTLINGTFTCEDHVTLEIDLGGMFNIHYVIIYEGQGIDGQLDLFNVFLKDGEGFLVCSKSLASKLMPAQKRLLRVNCIPTPIQSSKIVIDTLGTKVIQVYEIEAHTFGVYGSDRKVLINRGCFKQFGGVPRTTFGSLLESCQEECSSEGYIFAAIEANSSCHCDGEYDESQEISAEFCNMRCHDNKNFCGGKGAYSVYMVIPSLPRYRGCYRSSGHPGREINKTTILKCLEICDNSIYASIKGSTCVCSDTISKTSVYDGCKTKCSGDLFHVCGGKYYSTVFETCLKVYLHSTRCQDLLKCSGSYDMFGQCVGECKPGFIGDHCLERSQYFEVTTIAMANVTEGIVSVYRSLHLWIGVFVLISTCYCLCFSDSRRIGQNVSLFISNT